LGCSSSRGRCMTRYRWSLWRRTFHRTPFLYRDLLLLFRRPLRA
jgi:hypothetical protein